MSLGGELKRRPFFGEREKDKKSGVRLLWPPPHTPPPPAPSNLTVTVYLNNFVAHWSPGRGPVGSDLARRGMLECLWLPARSLFLAGPLTPATAAEWGRGQRMGDGERTSEAKVGSDHLLTLWSNDLVIPALQHTHRRSHSEAAVRHRQPLKLLPLLDICVWPRGSGHKRVQSSPWSCSVSGVNTRRAAGWLYMSTHTQKHTLQTQTYGQQMNSRWR